MGVLGRGMSWVDLQFLGRPNAIATAVIQGGGTVGLIDPGPSTCLKALELGLQQHGVTLADVTHVLLTHIHLDHAGATGTILRHHPRAIVVVHERGAKHLADPSTLRASAERLYGDQMGRLWGEIAPVPDKNLMVVSGGEQVTVGDRTLEIAYTPGHASHHVSYYDQASGVAFVGDTAGICIDGGYVLPPTPPPDIDIELWRKSTERIEAWSPQTIFLTHFGPVGHPRAHLQTLLENLETMAGWVRTLLAEPDSDENRAKRFAERVRRELRRQMTDAQLASYRLAAPLELLFLGLARYWRKRGAPIQPV